MINVAPASYSQTFQAIWPKICGDLWRAMITAAPEPPTEIASHVRNAALEEAAMFLESLASAFGAKEEKTLQISARSIRALKSAGDSA